jgi:murein DD-endopeptidase MepM/ murein hydrolase activator NlpD
MAAMSALNLTPEAMSTISRGFLDSLANANENSQKSGVISTISKTTDNAAANSLQFKKTIKETYSTTLPFDVKYVESANYYNGTQIVQKNGVNGEERITADVTYIGDKEVSREIVEIETIKEPVSKVIVIGTKTKPLPGPTGGFIRPVRGGYVTSRYSSGHRGVDMVVGFGSLVAASDGGTVIYAGFSGSYGNHVKIRHSDGFVTLYAHLSSISVSYGDKIFQGQEIGKVGSTGRSTGPHLHFEIIKNGVQVNPDSYLK